MSIKGDIIRLGEQLSREENAAFDLWTWLPSYKEARKYHGDYADEQRPSTDWIMREACHVLAELKYGENAEIEDIFKCPCDNEHHPDINTEDVVAGIAEGKSVTEVAFGFEVEDYIIDNILDFHREEQFSAARE